MSHLNDWHTNFAVTVSADYIFHHAFHFLPKWRLGWETIVHASDCLNSFCHNSYRYIVEINLVLRA
ncbi:Uncharacterised protein [Vibrio cholerae]|uniref:Uncharacterized protein n=1 Tax=Vibrio cholerae TaxID=666 RepID=A0A655YV20_VIBCL|nr:Uncharacterised protein [Vibrio cholerae]CSB48590.1 Uncharacterised protein [Vibrio cholerae]CSB50835.1 Uncharacterised protein [Vibrio cholerae]CSC30178.1 Uncharacterised protein [Vibrio cholerae]CSC43798.1 Uncharacterised protein [Vibrio cholerae]